MFMSLFLFEVIAYKRTSLPKQYQTQVNKHKNYTLAKIKGWAEEKRIALFLILN